MSAREEKAALVAAVQALDFVRLRAEAQNQAKNLSYGNQRLLEIARALATQPQLVILDEPAGGMNEQETASLISLDPQSAGSGGHGSADRTRHEPGDARVRKDRGARIRLEDRRGNSAGN